MHSAMSEELVGARDADRRGSAKRSIAASAAGFLSHCGNRIVIRRAGPADEPAVRNLAALDDHEWLGGPVLLAEVDGSLRAAVSLEGGEAFADPFCDSAEVSALLEVRAAQLGRPEPKRSRLRLRPRWALA